MRVFCLLILVTLLAVPDAANGQRRPRRPGTDKLTADRPDKLLREAILAMKSGDLGKAEALIAENLQAYPMDPASLGLLAQVKYRKDEKKEAREILRKTLQRYPDNKALNMLAANLLMRENKPVAALEYYQRAKNSNSDTENELAAEEDDPEALREEIRKSLKQIEMKKPSFYEQKPDKSLKTAFPDVPAERRIKIAVFEFRTTGDTSQFATASGLADILTTTFVQSNCFRVVERQQIGQILQEQDFQMTDAVDQETAASVGYIMGVDAVVVGSFHKFAKSPEVDARLVDVASGQIMAASSAVYNDRTDLEELVKSLSQSVYQ